MKVEYHPLEEHQFCSGLHFVQRLGGTDEDDGWIICYVHDESTNLSHVRSFKHNTASGNIFVWRYLNLMYWKTFQHDRGICILLNWVLGFAGLYS